jgi:hypothetical protein
MEQYNYSVKLNNQIICVITAPTLFSAREEFLEKFGEDYRDLIQIERKWND